MIALFCLTAIVIFRSGRSHSNMPLAPYNIKLYCRTGPSYIPETRTLSLCPSSSTSCGYFEFETLSSPGNGEQPLAIYECVDSSVLMSDNDDNEEEKQMLFSKYCNDQARCRNIMLSAFNPKFVQYLARLERAKLQKLLATRVKFCCAINDPLLQKIIHSGDDVLPTLPPAQPVICNGIRCTGAPIGCLTYSRQNETGQSEQQEEKDVIFVQPVQHINDEDYTMIPSQPINNNKYTTKYSPEYHCVYRHFNDELYRYCLLVNDQSSNSNQRCFYGDGYQICCCFLSRGAHMCDPLSTEIVPQTSTEAAAEIALGRSTKSVHSFSAVRGIKLRTRCRTVYEKPSETTASANLRQHKKLLCDTDVISGASHSPLYFLLIISCFLANYFTSNVLFCVL